MTSIPRGLVTSRLMTALRSMSDWLSTAALSRQVHRQGRSKGWLFQSNQGIRFKFSHYDPTFRALIDAARALHPTLLPDIVETGD